MKAEKKNKSRKDFISSLFWVLESKRLVAISNLDKEKQVFLCAPFERKDLIGKLIFVSIFSSLDAFF